MLVMARFMAKQGHILRSGGARGADRAFEMGADEADGTKEIYLPYRGFNKSTSKLYKVTREARILANQFHPNWPALGCVARDFMGRNCYQLLGLDLKTPTEFIICWTPNGKITGGTGQALRMAEHYRIPVFNLGSMSLDEVDEGISTILEGNQ